HFLREVAAARELGELDDDLGHPDSVGRILLHLEADRDPAILARRSRARLAQPAHRRDADLAVRLSRRRRVDLPEAARSIWKPPDRDVRRELMDLDAIGDEPAVVGEEPNGLGARAQSERAVERAGTEDGVLAIDDLALVFLDIAVRSEKDDDEPSWRKL